MVFPGVAGLTLSEPGLHSETDFAAGVDATDGGYVAFGNNTGYLSAGYTDADGPYIYGGLAPVWITRKNLTGGPDPTPPYLVIGPDKDPVATTTYVSGNYLPAVPYPGFPTYRYIPLDGVAFKDLYGSLSNLSIYAPSDDGDGGSIVCFAETFNGHFGYIDMGFTDIYGGAWIGSYGSPIWISRDDDDGSPCLVIGPDKTPVLTTETGLEVVDNSADWETPGAKRTITTTLTVGDRTAGHGTATIFASWAGDHPGPI